MTAEQTKGGLRTGSKSKSSGKIVLAAFVLMVVVFIAADVVRDQIPSSAQVTEEEQINTMPQTTESTESTIYARVNDPANPERGKIGEGQARSMIDSERVIVIGAINIEDIPIKIYIENGALIDFNRIEDNGDGTETIYYTISAPDTRYTGGIEMTFVADNSMSGLSESWTSGVENSAIISENKERIDFKMDYAIAA